MEDRQIAGINKYTVFERCQGIIERINEDLT